MATNVRPECEGFSLLGLEDTEMHEVAGMRRIYGKCRCIRGG